MVEEGEVSASPGEPDPSSLEEALLQVIGDPVARAILAFVSDKAATPQELKEASGAPQSTVYRKIAQMESWGLIGLLRSVVRPDGHRIDHYRARVTDVKVELRGGRFVVGYRRQDLASERLGSLWHAVREAPGR